MKIALVQQHTVKKMEDNIVRALALNGAELRVAAFQNGYFAALDDSRASIPL